MSKQMTNYNEKLDDVLASHGAEEGEFTESLKQAITSLIKELVAEAKPEIKAHPLGPVTLADCQRGLNHYEANLLKALEEV